MTDKKWKCVTYTVLGKTRSLRWFDRWNPWALRRHIETLEGELRCLERECELSREAALCNLLEKEKAVGQMRSDIAVVIGRLKEIANEG